jgi:hypothetical protein
LKVCLEGFSEYFLNSLAQSATNYGIKIIQDVKKCDVRITIDPTELTALDKSRDIVILAEPEVVRPDLYKSKILDGSIKILPLGRYRAERLGLKNWIEFPPEIPSYSRSKSVHRKKFAIVNEHKFSSSSRSNYGLRRKVIQYFEKNKPMDLDVYGKEWNTTKILELKRRFSQIKNNRSILKIDFKESLSDLFLHYQSVSGHMSRECSGLQNYEFNICIENDSDYISEKVWKALYAGSIPIYAGPNLRHDPELKKCVVPTTNSLTALINVIENFDEITAFELRQNAIDLLDNISGSKYSIENITQLFYTNLLEII